MVSDRRGRIRMPTVTLGAGGPVVSRIGLGLAALGRPAYITSGREQDLPDRSVAGMRTRTFSMLDAAYAAGWAVLVKEAVANGRLTAAGCPPAPLTALAAARGVTEDAIALAAALAQPWASVVLSGAVTRAQLDENLAALTVGQVPALSLAEAPDAYWAERAARPWH